MLVENINFTKVMYTEEAHFCSFWGRETRKKLQRDGTFSSKLKECRMKIVF
jgi:hypothetical protein